MNTATEIKNLLSDNAGWILRLSKSKKTTVPIDRIIKTLQNYYDFDFQESVGEGSFGKAWLDKSGDVVKITVDKEEANNASRIIGKQHKNVASIKGVAQIGDWPVFVITQEYGGDKLTDERAKEIIDNSPGSHEDLVKYYDNMAGQDQRFKGIADGLRWLKEQGIRHHDVTINNVLQNGNKFVLIDLSQATSQSSPMNKLTLEEQLNLIFCGVVLQLVE